MKVLIHHPSWRTLGVPQGQLGSHTDVEIWTLMVDSHHDQIEWHGVLSHPSNWTSCSNPGCKFLWSLVTLLPTSSEINWGKSVSLKCTVLKAASLRVEIISDLISLWPRSHWFLYATSGISGRCVDFSCFLGNSSWIGKSISVTSTISEEGPATWFSILEKASLKK